MRQYKMILVALLGLILTSCYNKFEEPEAPLTYDDNIFELVNPGIQQITIADLKGKFIDKFGSLSSTGINKGESDTKYLRFVANEKECTEYEIKTKCFDTGNYYIKGKVISNDEQGNIYKSLYIFDGTEAIELKLTNGLYLDYPCNLDTGETMWVYVKLRGLYLGNFRMMLSLGDIPTSSYNSYGNYKYYANSNLVSQNTVRQHVFPGKRDVLSESATDPSADIFVVDENSYSKIQGSNTEKFLGRLIRFKNLTVYYAGVDYPDENGNIVQNPTIANGQFAQLYPSWLCTSGIQATLPPVEGGTAEPSLSRAWYHMAYSMNNVALYGSICLTYKSQPKYTSEHGVYMLRTSGYSRFAGKYAPKHGSVGDVLAIFQIYAQKSDYVGNSGDWATYQIAINRIEDMQIETEPAEPSPEWSALIRWAENNFPHYVYPVTPDPAARAQAVADWKATYEASKPANDGSELWQKWNDWADWAVWILENTPEESYLLPQQVVEDTDTIE